MFKEKPLAPGNDGLRATPGAMTRKLHFISGLPRSGSTLLASILRQNPRFHAGMSSPLAAIYLGVLERLGGKNPYHLLLSDEQRIAIARGLFASFYEHLDPLTVVFDTNRTWCAKLAGISRLFPEVRIICCVRQLAWIIDSFERLVQSQPFEPSKIFNYDPAGTVYTRAEELMKSSGVVSFAYSALKSAFFGPHASHLLLLNYESLAARPAEVLARVYEFIGEAPFPHDFEAVSYSAGEYDRTLGMQDLHTVKGKVEFVARDTILPPDIFRKYLDTAFWNDPLQNSRDVSVV
jgi:sulfotransferase